MEYVMSTLLFHGHRCATLSIFTEGAPYAIPAKAAPATNKRLNAFFFCPNFMPIALSLVKNDIMIQDATGNNKSPFMGTHFTFP
jgi:hypothetical protein